MANEGTPETAPDSLNTPETLTIPQNRSADFPLIIILAVPPNFQSTSSWTTFEFFGASPFASRVPKKER